MKGAGGESDGGGKETRSDRRKGRAKKSGRTECTSRSRDVFLEEMNV